MRSVGQARHLHICGAASCQATHLSQAKYPGEARSKCLCTAWALPAWLSACFRHRAVVFQVALGAHKTATGCQAAVSVGLPCSPASASWHSADCTAGPCTPPPTEHHACCAAVCMTVPCTPLLVGCRHAVRHACEFCALDSLPAVGLQYACECSAVQHQPGGVRAAALEEDDVQPGRWSPPCSHWRRCSSAALQHVGILRAM